MKTIKISVFFIIFLLNCNQLHSQKYEEACSIINTTINYFCTLNPEYCKNCIVDKTVIITETPFFIWPYRNEEIKFFHSLIPDSVFQTYVHEKLDTFIIDSCDICCCSILNWEEYVHNINNPPYKYYFMFYYPLFLNKNYSVLMGTSIYSRNIFYCVFEKQNATWLIKEIQVIII